MSDNALEVSDLRVDIATERGIVHAVRGIDLTVHSGEIVGIVGESGCGKTTLALAVLRLLGDAAVTSGSVVVDGVDVLGADDRALLDLRRGRMAYIPQDPLASLDPTSTVGSQIEETIRAQRRRISRTDAREGAITLMKRVGIRDAERRYRDFPHQFSGGMRQRVAIAIAVSGRPALIVADEPTTALDVTVQLQVLELLVRLVDEEGIGVCLITHDLAVVADVCDRVAVVYAGRVVEDGAVDEVLGGPRHPYTRALMRATPRADAPRGRLATIPGQPPDPINLPTGCAFAARCSHAWDACEIEPVLPGDSHSAACWMPYDQAGNSVRSAPGRSR